MANNRFVIIHDGQAYIIETYSMANALLIFDTEWYSEEIEHVEIYLVAGSQEGVK